MVGNKKRLYFNAYLQETKRAEITKTFMQAFFEYPTLNAQQYHVDVDEIDFLYDNVVPLRLRQRKQERAKYRLSELRDALQRSMDSSTGIPVPEGITLPPMPTEPEKEIEQHGMKRKIIFDKKNWTRRQGEKVYWVGMKGPIFPSNPAMMKKLEALIGHPFTRLNDVSFHSGKLLERISSFSMASLLMQNFIPKLGKGNLQGEL